MPHFLNHSPETGLPKIAARGAGLPKIARLYPACMVSKLGSGISLGQSNFSGLAVSQREL